MVTSAGGADELHRAGLHHECAKFFESEVILEGSQVELQCRHIEVAIAEFGARVVERKDVFRLVFAKQILGVYGQLKVCTFGEDLVDLTLDGLHDVLLLFSCHIFHFLFNTGFHLRSIFDLLADGHLMTSCH